jgi:hypothetical protein
MRLSTSRIIGDSGSAFALTLQLLRRSNHYQHLTHPAQSLKTVHPPHRIGRWSKTDWVGLPSESRKVEMDVERKETGHRVLDPPFASAAQGAFELGKHP